MTAYEIANILYNMNLDMNYQDYKEHWETEIHALEEEIFKLKYSKSILYYTLENIANNHHKYFDLFTKESE